MYVYVYVYVSVSVYMYMYMLYAICYMLYAYVYVYVYVYFLAPAWLIRRTQAGNEWLLDSGKGVQLTTSPSKTWKTGRQQQVKLLTR